MTVEPRSHPAMLSSSSSRAAIAAILALAPLATAAVTSLLLEASEFIQLALLVVSPIIVFAMLAAVMPSVRHLWNAPVATSVAISFLAILVYPIGGASSMIARLVVGDLRDFTDSAAFRQALHRQQLVEQGLTWSFSWLLLFGATYIVATLSIRSLNRRPPDR